jgi:hypothetical protein
MSVARLSGSTPPLGPGADPTARLAAFVACYLAFLDRQLDRTRTLRAGLLLAGLAAEQVRHWLRDEHRDIGDLARGLIDIALAATATHVGSPPARMRRPPGGPRTCSSRTSASRRRLQPRPPTG